MGFNLEQYKDVLGTTETSTDAKNWNNADGLDPYSYADGMDEYNYANGAVLCKTLHPFNAKKEQECIAQQSAGKATDPKSIQAQADLVTAQALLAKTSQPQQQDQSMSPMAIGGIIIGSLLAITVMVVVIKKVKAKK